jgi:hypothetical protein
MRALEGECFNLCFVLDHRRPNFGLAAWVRPTRLGLAREVSAGPFGISFVLPGLASIS